jgi:hypothetical protein
MAMSHPTVLQNARVWQDNAEKAKKSRIRLEFPQRFLLT